MNYQSFNELKSYKLNWSYLVIRNGREVLDVIGKVHGVSEGGLNMVEHHVIISLVGEADQELSDLTGRQL